MTTKEDGKTKRCRRKSAKEEDNDREVMSQGGPDLSESEDRDNGEGGANAGDEVDYQGRRRS